MQESQPYRPYRRGYLWGTEQPSALPEQYRKVSGDLYLFVDNATRHASASAGGSTVHIIGDPVDPVHPAANLNQLATDLASARSKGISSFREVACRLVGRFVLVHQMGIDSPRMLSDVTGMYSMFDGRDGSRRFVGSHARLVAVQIGAVAQGSGFPQAWGTCGNSTAFPEVSLRSPSLDLCLDDETRHRICSGRNAEPPSIEACAELMVERASGALRGLMARREVVISLTAGGDTRATLAIVMRIGACPQFFTYDAVGQDTTIDMSVAQAMARDLGLNHLLLNRVPNDCVPQSLLRALADSTSMSHGRGLTYSYTTTFGVDRLTHVRSNVVEFFRISAVDKACKQLRMIPDTPEKAARLYLTCVGKEWSPSTEAAAIGHFRRQFDDGAWFEALTYMDARDLYFIEHRMANWHSNLIAESDQAFDTFIIFNSHELFNAAMQIGKGVRASGALIQKVYNLAAPDVLRLPINPAKFP